MRRAGTTSCRGSKSISSPRATSASASPAGTSASPQGSSIHVENSHKYGQRGGRVLLLAGGWTPSPNGATGNGDFAIDPRRGAAGEVCALNNAPAKPPPCYRPRRHRRPTCSPSSPGSSSSRSILSWLFAFNVLNTSSQGVRTFAVAIDRHYRAALPADPPHPARFRRDRFFAAGHPDPDPGAQEAARRRRYAILRRRMTATRIDGKAAAQAIRDNGRRACPRIRAPRGPRARSRHGAGRRGPGVAPSMSAPRTGDGAKPAWSASRTTCRDTTSEDELLQLVDRAQCRRSRRRHSGPASACRAQIDATRVIDTHRARQGRRRLSPDQCRAARDRPAGARPVHARSAACICSSRSSAT